MQNGSSDSSSDTFNSAFDLLSQWADVNFADTIQPLGPATVYTTSVTLWLMIYQRLNPKASLKDAVAHFIKNAPKGAKANKRLREGTLSTKGTSYSDARHRVSMASVLWLQNRVSDSIINSTSPSFNNQRVFLVDGTTFSLEPLSELRSVFPASSNQHGESLWPTVLVVVAHELSSGAALPPEIGAMYGENAISETRLAEPLIKRLPTNSIVMADAGFGIYFIAHQAKKYDHNFVIRLTDARFVALKKKAILVDTTSTSRTYKLTWQPSAKERANTKNLPDNCFIETTLYELKIGTDLWMNVATDLETTPKAIRELYTCRNDVEIDIRNIKVVIDGETLLAKSEAMFRKEFAMSMVAYNLTTQLRRQAAVVANCKPRELSFTGVWTIYRHFLQGEQFSGGDHLQAQFDLALRYASQQKLRKRPGRSFPREAYRKTSKSSNYKKRNPPEKPNESKVPTPK